MGGILTLESFLDQFPEIVSASRWKYVPQLLILVTGP